MTAQSSAAKPAAFAKFGAYFTYKLRFLRPNIILNAILALLSYPLAFGLMIPMCRAHEHLDHVRYEDIMNTSAFSSLDNAQRLAVQEYQKWSSIATAGVVVGCICLATLAVFTLVTTVRCLRYLYDRNYVDMDYSLPINGSTRFCADTLAVLSATIVPHFVGIILGMVLMNIANLGIVFPGREDIISIIPQYMFVGLCACVMLVGLTMLMLSFCGKKAEACIYPVLINIAIPLIHILCIFIVESNTYGGCIDYSLASSYQIGFTSPMGMVLAAFVPLMTGAIPEFLPLFTPQYGIPALIVTLAFIAGAYFLMKNRRNERVGSPYVFGAMDYVIPGIVILAVVMPLAWQMFACAKNDDSPFGWLIGTLISTFIIYIIMDLISGKAFRKFWLTAAKWAGTVAVSVGITAVLFYSNGFGAAYYVPKADDVASVSATFRVEGYYFDFDDVAEADAIDAVIDAHALIPKDGSADGDRYVLIKYNMKNGSMLTRDYLLTEECVIQCLRKVVTPSTLYNNIAGILEKKINDGLSKIQYLTVGLAGFDGNFSTGGLAAETLAAAIKQDCENADFDKAFAGRGTYNFDLFAEMVGEDISYNVYIKMYSWMQNTIALLGQYGINIGTEFDITPYKSAYIIKYTSDDERNYRDLESIVALSEGIKSMDPSDYYDIPDGDEDYPSKYADTRYYSYSDSYTFAKVDINDSRVAELVDGMTAEYSGVKKNKYELLLGTWEDFRDYNSLSWSVHNVYFPEEYFDIAEGLYMDYVTPETLAMADEKIMA